MERPKHVYFTTSWKEWELEEDINNFLEKKYAENRHGFGVLNIDIKPVVVNETVGFMATVFYQE